MRVRYQFSLIALGELPASLRAVSMAAVTMGHLPIDLTTLGAGSEESIQSAIPHLQRTDYLVLLVPGGPQITLPEIRRVEAVFEYTVGKAIPVHLLLDTAGLGGGSVPDRHPLPAVQRLADKLAAYRLGRTVPFEGSTAQAALILAQVIDAYPRPGWVSAAELPPDHVAAELSRLSRANQRLREQVIHLQGEEQLQGRFEEIEAVLRGNKILIPLWPRGAAGWGKPIETTLFEFFVRVGSEIAADASTLAIAAFIPMGVCELNPEDYRPNWPVPSNALNLWLADLMALGLVVPANRRRGKDSGQYWRLTRLGRLFLGHLRHVALERGGHRHVGFTSEFPIVP